MASDGLNLAFPHIGSDARRYIVVVFPFAFNPDKITIIRVITCYYIRKDTVYKRFVNTRTNSYGCYFSRMLRNIIPIGVFILNRVPVWS